MFDYRPLPMRLVDGDQKSTHFGYFFPACLVHRFLDLLYDARQVTKKSRVSDFKGSWLGRVARHDY